MNEGHTTDQEMRQAVMREFTEFIQTYSSQQDSPPKYLTRAKEAIMDSRRHVDFEFKDLMVYNSDLAKTIFDDYYRYEPVINQALTHFMVEFEKSLNHEDERRDEDGKETYQCSFDTGYHENTEDNSVRALKCGLLGKLITLKGTVTRTTEVRPELKTGVFKCRSCGKLSKPIIQQFKYTEPKKCSSENCDRNSWQLEMTRCTFADFQKIRVQQDPTRIPPGAMPRSIDVIVRNEFTEKGQPGDICEIVGYLCVLPELASMLKPGQKTQMSTRNNQSRGLTNTTDGGITGIKGMRDLSYKLIFVAVNIKVQNNQFDEFDNNNQEEEIVERRADEAKQQFDQSKIWQKLYENYSTHELHVIRTMSSSDNKYKDMAESLFPTIYGHEQIKKALLLQLIGGIHKRTTNKINIRGDINILIVGDPSSAKSQFLKCVNKFVPRSVYTNGKTTSAAGLTASVTRDENGNVGIEAGALMLADNGICCIDEFDKMDIKDQVAIHEAMEQQTISIAKAGVYATLHARTSILAAANPIFGRYQKAKSLKNNINLSAPIMSRFDLFFVVCDQSDNLADQHLSEFIINLHRFKTHAVTPRYSMKQLKTYISLCRKLKPQLTSESARLLRDFYIDIRRKDKTYTNSYRVTVRQLESMIRLSEAYARLDLSLQVTPKHVKEAYRLLSCSILKLEKPDVDLEDDTIDRMQRMSIGGQKLNEGLMKKQQEKKVKNLSISHQLYRDLQKRIYAFFEEKRSMHDRQQIEDDFQATQQDLCMSLLGKQIDSGSLSSVEQGDRLKAVYNGVIKKLIREEHMLMVVEDNAQVGLRILQIHPNYIQQ